jgi:transcriptional regulator with XRE-family HTH domain
MADMPSQRITISDVAREAGVSRTTVSHALNGRGQVDPATRLKVEEAARSLGYRPNRHAQRLRTGGASMIALMSSMPFTVSGGRRGWGSSWKWQLSRPHRRLSAAWSWRWFRPTSPARLR